MFLQFINQLGKYDIYKLMFTFILVLSIDKQENITNSLQIFFKYVFFFLCEQVKFLQTRFVHILFVGSYIYTLFLKQKGYKIPSVKTVKYKMYYKMKQILNLAFFNVQIHAN